MFANSLLERLERRKVLVKMFADDLVIASGDADETQRALTTMSIWCEENSMSVNVEKTKIVKFRKAGPQGKKQLYINRIPVEIVQQFKYLGVVMQPALKFGEHVDSLLTRTATTIACLGNLRKLPVDLALKIFDIKIMPTIRYGMRSIAPRLAKTSMINLDRCKTLYLKAVLGLSRHTSNTFVLALVREKTLCEDLSGMGYKFEPWSDYMANIETRRSNYREQEYETGPAFSQEDWKLENRIDRAEICRTTYHGYHHKLCTKEDFYTKPDDRCSCKYCGKKKIDRMHILKCKHFDKMSIRRIVREVTKNC